MIETAGEGSSAGDRAFGRNLRSKGLAGFLCRPALLDAGLLLLFAGLAVCFQISRTHLVPDFMDLTGDAANIAGFAAALDHPDFFEGDGLLADPRNFRFYATIHLPLIRLLAKLTGSYGNAFASTLGVHLFLQLTGFFILGRVLFRSRFWAFVLALVTLPYVSVGLVTHWGLSADAIPRMSFSSLFGFLLAAALYWRSSPLAWPGIMLAAGLLMYVHPVSAPTAAFAVWLGFWAMKPASWSRSAQGGYMLFLGLVFLLAALPFLAVYLSSHEHGRVDHYDQIMSILEYRFVGGFMNVPLGLAKIFAHLIQSMVLPMGVLGACVLFRWGNPDRKILITLGLWLLGIVLAAGALPWAVSALNQAMRALPVQIDLIRGLRLAVPLLLIIFVWGLAEMEAGERRLLHGGLLLAGCWFAFHARMPVQAPLIDAPLSAAEVVILGKQGTPERADVRDAVQAVRKLTPPRSRIFTLDRGTALRVRYAALRPVVLCSKDGGALAYTNLAELTRWYPAIKRFRALRGLPWSRHKANGLLHMAREFRADFLLSEGGAEVAALFEGAALVWTNGSFFLIRVQAEG